VITRMTALVTLPLSFLPRLGSCNVAILGEQGRCCFSRRRAVVEVGNLSLLR
jgi:hypothetical protein